MVSNVTRNVSWVSFNENCVQCTAKCVQGFLLMRRVTSTSGFPLGRAGEDIKLVFRTAFHYKEGRGERVVVSILLWSCRSLVSFCAISALID
jgi:hypothetical protein